MTINIEKYAKKENKICRFFKYLYIKSKKRLKRYNKKKLIITCFLILFCLILELDREGGHLKRYPTLPMKYFECYNNNYCWAKGSWDNTSYPNTSEITCDKSDKLCTIQTADILFNVLGTHTEYFNIISWDKNGILSEDIYGYNGIPVDCINDIEKVKNCIQSMFENYNPTQKFYINSLESGSKEKNKENVI